MNHKAKSILFFILFFLLSNSIFAANKTEIINLSNGGWEYRWGDSTFKDQLPLWTQDPQKSPHWKSIDFPSNPEGREGRTNIWYRTLLPETLPKNPHIYIFSIDLIAEVYMDGKKIYNFGEFDKNGHGEFQGWPWHMISLPKKSEGKLIYFRIFSDYPDIGLWGEVQIGSKGALYEMMLEKDLHPVIAGSILLFLGVLFSITYLAKTKKIEMLMLGLLFLSQALDLLFRAKFSQLFFEYHHLKQYLIAISYFFLPIGVAVMMDKIVGAGPFKLIRRIWQIHLIYITVAVLGALLGFYAISDTYTPFDYLFYFFTWPALTISALLSVNKGDYEAKIMIVGFMIVSIFWFYSTLIAWNIVPWQEYPIDIPVTICLMLFAYAIIRRIFYTQELENIIIEKTEENFKQQERLHQQSKQAAMGNLVGVIAHQLKQPLNNINMVSYLIQDNVEHKEDPAEVTTFVKEINRSVAFMSESVDDLKNFFRKDKIKKVFNLHKCIDKTIHLLLVELSKHKITLDLKVEKSFELNSYENELQQVIINIVNNAKDILVDKKVSSPIITINTEKEKNFYLIKISDNGGGIPEEILPKIFDSYLTTKGEDGTGIGLHLSKMIIKDSLGGEIYAKNIEEGALFTIKLPLS